MNAAFALKKRKNNYSNFLYLTLSGLAEAERAMLLVAAGRTLAVFDGRRDEDYVFTITSSSSLSSSESSSKFFLLLALVPPFFVSESAGLR